MHLTCQLGFLVNSIFADGSEDVMRACKTHPGLLDLWTFRPNLAVAKWPRRSLGMRPHWAICLRSCRQTVRLFQ